MKEVIVLTYVPPDYREKVVGCFSSEDEAWKWVKLKDPYSEAYYTTTPYTLDEGDI